MLLQNCFLNSIEKHHIALKNRKEIIEMEWQNDQ